MNHDLISETFSEIKSDEELIETQIKFNLGRLKLEPFSSDKIFKLDASYPNENYTPIVKYKKGSRGSLTLESQKVGTSFTSTFSLDKVVDLFSKEKRDQTISSSSNTWDLKLNKDIPFELTVKGGASEQHLELGGMHLRYLRMSTGASLSSISFSEYNPERLEIKIESGAASFEATGLGYANIDDMKFDGGVGKSRLNFSGELKNNSVIEISGGLGLVELEIPKDTGTIVRAKNSRLLSINKLPDSYTKKGEIYVNEAFEDDKPHLNLNIDIALGSLNIKEI